jgi:hypothetical protein
MSDTNVNNWGWLRKRLDQAEPDFLRDLLQTTTDDDGTGLGLNDAISRDDDVVVNGDARGPTPGRVELDVIVHGDAVAEGYPIGPPKHQAMTEDQPRARGLKQPAAEKSAKNLARTCPKIAERQRSTVRGTSVGWSALLGMVRDGHRFSMQLQS